MILSCKGVSCDQEAISLTLFMQLYHWIIGVPDHTDVQQLTNKHAGTTEAGRPTKVHSCRRPQNSSRETRKNQKHGDESQNSSGSLEDSFCSRDCCLCAVHQSVKERRHATKQKLNQGNQTKPSKNNKKQQNATQPKNTTTTRSLCSE